MAPNMLALKVKPVLRPVHDSLSANALSRTCYRTVSGFSREQLTKVQVGSIDERAQNAADNNGSDSERVRLVWDRIVHLQRLPEIFLLDLSIAVLLGVAHGNLCLELVRTLNG